MAIASPADLVPFLAATLRVADAFSGLLTTIVQIFSGQEDASHHGIHAGSFIRNCEWNEND